MHPTVCVCVLGWRASEPATVFEMVVTESVLTMDPPLTAASDEVLVVAFQFTTQEEVLRCTIIGPRDTVHVIEFPKGFLLPAVSEGWLTRGRFPDDGPTDRGDRGGNSDRARLPDHGECFDPR